MPEERKDLDHVVFLRNTLDLSHFAHNANSCYTIKHNGLVFRAYLRPSLRPDQKSNSDISEL